jgi:hypothetical protein
MGKPAVEIKFDDVRELAQLQKTPEEIAAHFGVKPGRIRGQFQKWLPIWRQWGQDALTKAQWKVALEGNGPMLNWLGRQHLRQRPTQREGSDDVVIVIRRVDRRPQPRPMQPEPNALAFHEDSSNSGARGCVGAEPGRATLVP